MSTVEEEKAILDALTEDQKAQRKAMQDSEIEAAGEKVTDFIQQTITSGMRAQPVAVALMEGGIIAALGMGCPVPTLMGIVANIIKRSAALGEEEKAERAKNGGAHALD